MSIKTFVYPEWIEKQKYHHLLYFYLFCLQKNAEDDIYDLYHQLLYFICFYVTQRQAKGEARIVDPAESGAQTGNLFYYVFFLLFVSGKLKVTRLTPC